jgi:alpha-amylase/alpha-mannosidase (GH57 family)
MPKIHVCFLWHMHQPFYKDLAAREYRLPWTRMHALKDYFGMVKVLGGFPQVRQTFNLVPSMLVQIEEYAQGIASDPFLRCALKPAGSLTEDERLFILQYFFQANVDRLIGRYPRYRQLYELWLGAGSKAARAARVFRERDLRDLQVLSQLAWFDEEFLAHDAETRELAAKGVDYSLADQACMGQIQLRIVQSVLPVYREFAASGQIELSTTPFYHPILPLLCDSRIASVAHPGVPLPAPFRYPEDAREQLSRARSYMQEKFGRAPVGLWPSEGSVSNEALALAADCGFTWAATDNGVLARTLNRAATPDIVYRPFVWRHSTEHGAREMRMIFRDHELSDLIGFTYQRVPAANAARNFLDRIRANCAPILRQGRNALAPVILDGENCWEYYPESGREFLRLLYQGLSEDPQMEAVTVSEGLARVEPATLGHIFPGSWINANFDIWIGAEEDNQAWEYLLRARQTYDQAAAAGSVPPDRLAFAFEELLIAEGSDWCWWYGPEHHTDNRAEFDQLFRDHLRNVYTALSLTPPDELARPILRAARQAVHQKPAAPVEAVIDGEVTSFFEWMGAGVFEVDGRQGAMHGGERRVARALYGSAGDWGYVRLDLLAAAEELELEITGPEQAFALRLRAGEPFLGADFAAALGDVLELKLPLALYPQLRVTLLRQGIPVELVPEDGWIDLTPGAPDWA